MAKWYVSAKKADFVAIGAKFGIDQVTARIIRNRTLDGSEPAYCPVILYDSSAAR